LSKRPFFREIRAPICPKNGRLEASARGVGKKTVFGGGRGGDQVKIFLSVRVLIHARTDSAIAQTPFWLDPAEITCRGPHIPSDAIISKPVSTAKTFFGKCWTSFVARAATLVVPTEFGFLFPPFRINVGGVKRGE
jgi:hypothetical protein